MSTPRAVATCVVLMVAAVVIAGCGGSKKKASTATTTTVARAKTPPRKTSTAAGIATAGAQRTGGPGSAIETPVTGAPGAAGLTNATTSSSAVRPFADASPWNTPIASLPTDPKSAQYIRLAQFRIGVVEQGNAPPKTTRVRVTTGLFVNTRQWTDPIVDGNGGVVTRIVCRQLPPYCGDGTKIAALTIPPGDNPHPEYDGWFTVLDRTAGIAYDLWRARRAPGQNVISYQYLREWDLNGPGFQAPNGVSARGSGLPLFAGEVLPQEIAACRIDHALAISVPGPAQKLYVQPASATDGNGSQSSLPEGARIRLRSDFTFDWAKLPGRTNRCAARAIVTALKRYGAIVVDRSRVPTLYAKFNYDWAQPLRSSSGELLSASGQPLNRFLRRLKNQSTPQLRGSEVAQIRISDFEVVALGPTHNFPAPSTQGISTTGTGAGTGGQTFTPEIP